MICLAQYILVGFVGAVIAMFDDKKSPKRKINNKWLHSAFHKPSFIHATKLLPDPPLTLLQLFVYFLCMPEDTPVHQIGLWEGESILSPVPLLDGQCWIRPKSAVELNSRYTFTAVWWALTLGNAAISNQRNIRYSMYGFSEYEQSSTKEHISRQIY